MTAGVCYVAGPMTGISGFNYWAFDSARDQLIAEGWEVISPADLDRKNLNIDFSQMRGDEDLSMHRTTFARQDIDALLKVQAVFLLPGWQQSTGAMNEARIATMLGVDCFEFVSRDRVDIDAPFSAVRPAERNNRATVLLGAEELVNGDRNAQYGDPRQDFQRTADLWNTYLDYGAHVRDDGSAVSSTRVNRKVQPHDVAAMMALLKISRIAWSPQKLDSWMDLAGYAACGWDCAA